MKANYYFIKQDFLNSILFEREAASGKRAFERLEYAMPDQEHPIDQITAQDPENLKLSIYLPYYKKVGKQNPTKNKLVNLIRRAEFELKEKYGDRFSESILQHARTIGRQIQSNREEGGAAIFIDLKSTKVLELDQTPDAAYHLGNQFYIKPLMDSGESLNPYPHEGQSAIR